ncbi:MAG: 3-ketoacyl-ACP reductase [Clostridia bacterium]|nr:3-ketoacyl-ACP reductase [Clostridia bacterium]
MGKNILLTGGTRGIGAAIAEILLKSGHRVLCCGRSEEYHGPAEYFRCDVSQSRDRERLVEEALRRMGSIEVLVNNAGVAPEVRADLLEATEESFERVMAINLKGPFFLTQKVAQAMAAAGSASGRMVINIGSISAEVASINRGDYCMSKAAVAMATQLWAVRLAEFGINVYEIRPGVIHTDMTHGVSSRYDALIEGGLTLQPRWGEPEDVARAVRMLVQEELPYSTGQVLRVDGGMFVHRL